MSSSESRSPNATPSRTARVRCGRPWWIVETDERAARRAGPDAGVRSPVRYGRKSSPSLPAGTDAASSTRSANPTSGANGVAEPAEAAGRRQHHAHHVPAIRHAVAERVQAALGFDPRSVRGGEDDARRPERERDDPGFDGADADRRRRLISAAGDHRRPGAKAGRLGGLGGHRAGHLRALVRPRQPRRVDAERGDDLVRPVAPREVEQERPGAVGAIDGVVAGEPKPDEVLRQQDVGDRETTPRARAGEPTGASAP